MKRATRQLVIYLWIAALSAVSAGAQIPDEFTNLQVLPKDTEKPALIEAMREFAGGLGVRCNHCHVGENGDSLEGMDFASDDKETKRVAREMMRMTREINATFLPRTGREDLLAVNCRTCHHGVERPQDLRDLLAGVLEEGGVEAVGVRYRKLHGEYFGKGAYNFSEFTLTSLAERAARQQGDPATALALLDLNAELHPESSYTYVMQARIHMMSGARDDAIESFERALEIAPDNAWAHQQLERLKAPPQNENP